VKWEGTHKRPSKKKGAWELKHEGTMPFVGGTGKFKNIKGKVFTKERAAKESTSSGKFEAKY